MRKRIATALAVGAIGVGGLAVSGAASAADTTGTATTSRVQAVKDALKGLVGDGSISQAQADEVATTLGSADLGPGGGHGGGGRGADLATAATTLKLSEDDLRTQLQAGRTLAQVASAQGVAVDDLVTALVDAQKTRIAAQVTAGTITQAQADERLADLKQRITDRVNAAGGGGRGGRGPGGGSAPTPSASPSASSSTSSSTSSGAAATSGT